MVDTKGKNAYNVPIRTLHVAAITPNMTDQIKMYFKQFGTVNSVEIQEKNDENFAFVEFKTVEAAAAVLSSNETHQIGDCDVQVKAAEPWQQPDHILNALDDDCLRAILLQLNLFDLANAANVCVRFNEQAKSVFSTKYDKKLDLTDCFYEVAGNALQTFGSLARSVNLSGKGDIFKLKNELISMIVQCCTSQLKELTFHEFCFEKQYLSDILFGSALCTMEKLSFDQCFFWNSSSADFLSSCTELKVLHISNCDLANVPKTALKKLEEIRLFNVQMLDVNRYIHSESKLKKISLLESQYAWYTTRVIAQHCPNLVELELTMNGCTDALYAESVHRLKQFTSLKVLKLDLRWKSTAPLSTLLASNSAPIEHMKLILGSIDADTVKAIAQMEHLKVLELSAIERFTDEHMIELAKGLGSKLEKLQLGRSTAENLTTIGLKKALPFATKLSLLTLESETITIDADDYDAMLCTLKKRPEKVKLLIELTGKEGQVEVSEQVQKENYDWFFIDGKFQIESEY